MHHFGLHGIGLIRRSFRDRHAHDFAAVRQLLGTMTVGKEAVMPDAMESIRQNVQQEPTHELGRREPHDLRLAAAGFAIILPAKGHMPVVDIDEPVVADGDAMRVSGEIPDHLLGAGERLLPLKLFRGYGVRGAPAAIS